jgi:predicted GIY-YIG superfamily endonuclease
MESQDIPTRILMLMPSSLRTNAFSKPAKEVETVNQVQAFEDLTAMHDAKSNPQAVQARRKTMPFGSDSSFVFTERGIAAYAPRTSGVYGIFNQKGCIYVGAAQDLEASLYSHLRGGTDQSCWIRRQNPTHFAFEQCDEKSGNRREMQLIAELNPVCNRN